MDIKKIKINGFTLKIITGISLFSWVLGNVFNNIDMTIRFILVTIGMISYPLMAFMVSEGFLHSSNLKKYIIRLTLLAVVSEPFYDFTVSRFKVPDMFYSQNVIFTLLIGLIGLFLYDFFVTKYKNNKLKMNISRILVMLFSCMTAVILSSEFNYYGVLMIFIMYIFKKDKVIMMLAITAQIFFAGYDLMYFQLLALPFLLVYSGQEGKKAQKCFYAFYPVMLAFIGAAAYFII